jgi:hypothetical protein
MASSCTEAAKATTLERYAAYRRTPLQYLVP